MHNGKVSVLLATFNNGRFLEAAVNSILAQTYRNLELLVMNDGSTDSTAEILNAIARSDQRVRILTNASNAGLIASLNTLIDNADGEFIARMDGDDIARPERIARQVAVMNERALDVCGSWLRTFGRLRSQVIAFPVSDEEIRATLLFRNPFLHPSLVVRRWVFDTGLRFRNEAPHAEDYDLFARLPDDAALGNVPEPLMLYRKHSGQVSAAKAREQWQSAAHVRGVYLSRLGVPASPDERELHGRVRAPFPPETRREVEDMEAWLMKLARHFKERANWDHVIGMQWFLLMLRSASFGSWTWKTYRSSPLTRLYRPPSAHLWQLRALCAARLRYRSRLFQFLEQFS